MLRALAVRDYAIVEHLELEPAGGFNVLTGETGAGKSILVDAIELLVGGRADAAALREGAPRAELAAEFDVPPEGEIAAWLAENGMEGDAGRVLLRRAIERGGRSRAWINGQAATLAQLKDLGEFLVDIHGQHAHQSLLRGPAQRALLDAFGDAEAEARACAEAHRTWKRLETLAGEARANIERREAERALVAEQAADLAKLAPVAGEWEARSAEHRRLAHGAALIEGARSALEALDDSDEACLVRLAAVTARLRALAEHDAELAGIVELLAAAEAQAGEAARTLRHYASALDLDPQALRAAESRIEALHAAARRHRVRPEELAARADALRARLAELELAGDAAALEREVAAAKARLVEAAKALTAKRTRAARALGKAVSARMQTLAMKGGRFAVALRALEAPGAGGAEEVEFEVSSHPDLPLRALARVASGGELSRVSLAVQLEVSRYAPAATLVFDEVDSGIGGGVAQTVGEALRALGGNRQVLCVTHLPQVAAQGDAQWSVRRSNARGGPKIQVILLDADARVDELARMLGGTEITAISRRHAAELLQKQGA
ncbi:MAG TPA: DNA repair protein RecN [Burkholderiales bacterium]